MCCKFTKQKSKLIIQAHYFPTFFLQYFCRFDNLIFRRSFFACPCIAGTSGSFLKDKPLPYSYGNPCKQEYYYYCPCYAKRGTIWRPITIGPIPRPPIIPERGSSQRKGNDKC